MQRTTLAGLIFCLGFGHFTAQADGPRRCEIALAETAVELAYGDALLNQNDRSLRHIPGFHAGFCASTCLTNAALILLRNVGHSVEPSAAFAEILRRARIAWRLKGSEPDVAAAAHVVGDYVDLVLGTGGVGSYESQLLEDPQIPFFSAKDLRARADSVAVLSFVYGTPEQGHAIILVAMDLNKKTLSYIDPNLPDRVLVVPYRLAKRDGKSTLELDWHADVGLEGENAKLVDIVWFRLSREQVRLQSLLR